MLKTDFDHSKTLRFRLTSEEGVCDKQIELFILRRKRGRLLERSECLFRLAVPRVGLRQQVFDSRAIVWASAQHLQNWDGLPEFPGADVAEGKIELQGIFVRNAPLRSQKMRDRFGKRSPRC